MKWKHLREVRFEEGTRYPTRNRKIPNRFSSQSEYDKYYKSHRRPSGNLCKDTRFKPGKPLQKIRREVLNKQFLMTLHWNEFMTGLKKGTLGGYAIEAIKNMQDGCLEYFNPSLLAAKANSEDQPTFEEAMNGPNASGFKQAMDKEIETLEANHTWDVVPRPKGKKVISTTWNLRVKRLPSGFMSKLKARLCCRGFEQIKGLDYTEEESYSPVVSWVTVRILLIMSILLNLSTLQIDYTAAFTQADINQEVYIEIPRGYKDRYPPGSVFKLNKALYGLAVSGKTFFLHLKENLEKVGFVQSDADACLFVSEKVICLVYVDDTLFFARDQKDIDKVAEALKKLKMDFTIEDDVAGFLGVHIDRRPDGTIEMTQKGLIDRIIDALSIDHLGPRTTPADVAPLGKDPEGAPADAYYNYASVIGMMSYLQGHSRPDITYAVSQCARYTHGQKKSHEIALERIGQYLKSTRDNGLILKPIPLSHSWKIDIYVDAAFAPGWGHEDPADPSCVKSRTGYLIEVQGCPVIWCSKLQTNIATSTMESEYTAL